MAKELILEHLKSARKEYGCWVGRVESMMDNVAPKPEHTPLRHDKCRFGIWLNMEGWKIGRMPGMSSYKQIEEAHEKIHDLYSKLFYVYGSKEKHPVLHKIPKLEKNPLIYKLLTRKRRSSSSEKEVAVEYYKQLKETSKELLHSIERLERRITAMPKSSFSRIG